MGRYEHQAQYVNTKLTFMNIDNIHVMRASLRNFLGLLAPRSLLSSKEKEEWGTEIDKCGWMEHLRRVLRSSALVTHMVAVERYASRSRLTSDLGEVDLWRRPLLLVGTRCWSTAATAGIARRRCEIAVYL